MKGCYRVFRDICSGYIRNKTETKQFCFSFISDVTTALYYNDLDTEDFIRRPVNSDDDDDDDDN